MRWWYAFAGVGAAVVVIDVVLHAQGVGGFATHPVSAVALAAAGAAVAAIAARAPDRTREWLTALAIALTSYLVLGAWASAFPNPVAVALWAVAWMPITGLITIIGLASFAGARLAVAVAAAVAILTVAAALVTTPVAPFVGVATVAPEAWATRIAGATDLITAVFIGILVVAALFVIVMAARALPTERQQSLTCAAVTAGGPGLVVVCVALAVLADPGDVDPSTGSVGYLVAIAGTSILTSYAVVWFSRWAVRVILGSWTLAAAVLISVALSPLVAVQPSLGAIVIVVTVIACVGILVLVVGLLERWATKPRLQLVGGVVPRLSPRENEVLGLVAEGATNAGVAATLFLSERTVEQHLRSVFRKLDLGTAEGSNRRVRAATIWWQHQPDVEEAASEQTGS